jgi:hypothetical protein
MSHQSPITLWQGSPIEGASLGPDGQAATIRKWAELSFWFPVLAAAAGTHPVSGLGATCTSSTFNTVADCRNVDFTVEGTEVVPAKSHDYIYDSPFTQVWPAYQVFRKVFAVP